MKEEGRTGPARACGQQSRCPGGVYWRLRRSLWIWPRSCVCFSCSSLKKSSLGLKGFGIDIETFAQLAPIFLVKKRAVLAQIGRDQFVAQFLVMRHSAQTPADDRLEFAQRREGLDVEQLDPAGLENGGDVARVVIGGKGESSQLWALPTLERLLELAFLLGGFRRLCLGVLDPFLQLPLERSQDLVALPRMLLALLKVAQPKRGIDADKNEQKLGEPTTGPGIPTLFHSGYGQKNNGRRRTVKPSVGWLVRGDGCDRVRLRLQFRAQ